MYVILAEYGEVKNGNFGIRNTLMNSQKLYFDIYTNGVKYQYDQCDYRIRNRKLKMWENWKCEKIENIELSSM